MYWQDVNSVDPDQTPSDHGLHCLILVRPQGVKTFSCTK